MPVKCVSPHFEAKARRGQELLCSPASARALCRSHAFSPVLLSPPGCITHVAAERATSTAFPSLTSFLLPATATQTVQQDRNPPATAPRVLCRRSVSLAAPPFLFTTPSAASWRFQLASSEIGPGTRSGNGSGSPPRLRSQPSRFLEASHPQALGASGLRRNAPQDRVTWHGRWN